MTACARAPSPSPASASRSTWIILSPSSKRGLVVPGLLPDFRHLPKHPGGAKGAAGEISRAPLHRGGYPVISAPVPDFGRARCIAGRGHRPSPNGDGQPLKGLFLVVGMAYLLRRPYLRHRHHGYDVDISPSSPSQGPASWRLSQVQGRKKAMNVGDKTVENIGESKGKSVIIMHGCRKRRRCSNPA